MPARSTHIDISGAISLPRDLLHAAGIEPDSDVLVEVTIEGILLKPAVERFPITRAIASLNAPVADWEEMEKEIERGRLM